MTTTGPNPEFSAAVISLQYNLVGCIAALCDDAEGLTPADEALAQRVAEHSQSVRGNRPAHGVVSYADLRRIMTGTLRILLEHLEAHP